MPLSVIFPLRSNASANLRFRLLQGLLGLRGVNRTENLSRSTVFTRLSIQP